jgi:hypothetical protein
MTAPLFNYRSTSKHQSSNRNLYHSTKNALDMRRGHFAWPMAYASVQDEFKASRQWVAFPLAVVIDEDIAQRRIQMHRFRLQRAGLKNNPKTAPIITLRITTSLTLNFMHQEFRVPVTTVLRLYVDPAHL